MGIIGSDAHTIEGINYENSLKLCQSQLAFHGIGASKLTTCPEFENALVRCKQGKPIRFLLLNPEDATLISAAKRAQQNSDSYHERVVKSLRTIKELKEKRDFDIHVRFYSGKPIFRLMFVDDTLCLLSGYTQLGVDDGSKLPQVHLRNSSEYNHTNSLYSSFEHYFEALWTKSTEWDFLRYLN
ncbi:hypothetical protein HGB07_04815 [Candidatus Roizmanbacteria bacterium]|nr:hypothetical protein [Candidatus Roizmanbacteria bacterium]